MLPSQMQPALVKELSLSGLISYRPVVALSFFGDYFLWRGKAWGHNLNNILLHLTASLIVFYFIYLLTQKINLATMTALLFSVHPIHSEVVCNVGYRSDLLGTIFYLLTFVSFYKFFEKERGKLHLIAASYLSFFLSLFSKESAISLPLLLFFFDYLFLKEGTDLKTFLNNRFLYYLGFLLIWIFYIYIYFFVMRNVFYPQLLFLGDNIKEHFLIIFKILYHYLTVLFLPFKLTILPPFYAPAPDLIKSYEITIVIAVIMFCALWAGTALRKKEKLILFFLSWFFVTYIPVSNIIALPNPLAFRFLYLPSLAFFVFMAMGLEKILELLKQKTSSINWQGIIPLTVVGLSLAMTISNNAFFQNDFVACREMIRNYPDSSRPYWLLGLAYYEKKEYSTAIPYLKRYLVTPPRNPFVMDVKKDAFTYHILGRCYIDQPDMAISILKKVAKMRPDFELVYLDLAKIYLLKGDFKEVLHSARKALELNNESVLGYVYAIHSYIEIKQFSKAQEFLKEVKRISPFDNNVLYVEALFREKKQP